MVVHHLPSVTEGVTRKLEVSTTGEHAQALRLSLAHAPVGGTGEATRSDGLVEAVVVPPEMAQARQMPEQRKLQQASHKLAAPLRIPSSAV